MGLRRLENSSGASAVEFAIVAPIFAGLLFGIITFGGYFWLSHAIQELTNDAARAALAGLTTSERTSLANSTITSEMTSYAYLDSSKANVSVNNGAQALTVTVTYDASRTPFFAVAHLLPLPPTTITRTATIKYGGY
jgi:Flp pilus assembly protein TadG